METNLMMETGLFIRRRTACTFKWLHTFVHAVTSLVAVPCEMAPLQTPHDSRAVRAAAWVWLGVLAALLVTFFHPYRINVNADDAWPVLESAYHSLRRDGVLMWGSDRLAALHLIIAHVILEIFGLKRWVPHCFYLAAQQAVLLLAGLLWLNRGARTFLITGPLFVLCIAQPGANTYDSLHYWLCRVGIVYPMAMFTVLLTFGLLLRLAHLHAPLRYLLPALGVVATAAFISSPGNVVLIGVWFTLLFLQLLPRGKAALTRWAYCAAVLLLAYWLAAVCRRLYDHSVHPTRMATPMEFVWNQWMPTIQRFVRDTVKSGPFSVAIMVLGLTIAGVGSCAAVLRRFRFTARVCQRLQLTPYGAATMLSVSGVVYLVLLGANRWVHINYSNPTYVLPPFALFIAAGAWLVAALVRRLPIAVAASLAAALLSVACVQVWRLRPRTPSQMFHDVQPLLRLADEHGKPLALLGDFWNACVHSFFDPHRIISAPYDGNLISDAMLPFVLSHPLVLVNFTGMDILRTADQSVPDVFVQRLTVLIHSPDASPPHLPLWHAYRTVPPERLMLGANMIDSVQADLRGPATSRNGVFTLNYPSGPLCPEVFWRLGVIPRGLYLLTMTARYRGERPPDNVCVLHLYDHSVESTYPPLVIHPPSARHTFKKYGIIIHYPGSPVPATLRLYSLSRQPYDVTAVGLYPLSVDDQFQ